MLDTTAISRCSCRDAIEQSDRGDDNDGIGRENERRSVAPELRLKTPPRTAGRTMRRNIDEKKPQ